MKKNQMKFNVVNGKMMQIDFNNLNKPIALNFDNIPTFNKNDIELSFQNFKMIDIREVKQSLATTIKMWFPFGEKATTMAVGIFWTAFMTYIFPWLLDIAKVYCAWKIAQGFYRDGKGMGSKDGGSGGFANLVYYTKWYLMFWCLPFLVEVIDQIGHKLNEDLLKKGIDGLKMTN